MSIKTGTTSDFKDHYVIGFDENYVFGIWMWNKDWKKTLKWDFSLQKWHQIIDILKKDILGK